VASYKKPPAVSIQPKGTLTMGEQIQHPYPCHSLGCSNGHMSVFYGAPPEWFAEKGFNTPKNCPDCREWTKAQTDSAYRCKSCARPIRQTAKAKISHHKRKGVYEAPEQCNRCRDGIVTPESLEDEPSTLGELEETQSEVLPVVPYDQLSEYRKEHYGKHIPGHPFSQVGQLMLSGAPVSTTSLVGQGASSVELYFAASEIAGRTSGTYQYKNGADVIKATIVGGIHVEVTVFRPLSDGSYELVTSYDEVPIAEVQAKIDEKTWK